MKFWVYPATPKKATSKSHTGSSPGSIIPTSIPKTSKPRKSLSRSRKPVRCSATPRNARSTTCLEQTGRTALNSRHLPIGEEFKAEATWRTFLNVEHGNKAAHSATSSRCCSVEWVAKWADSAQQPERAHAPALELHARTLKRSSPCLWKTCTVERLAN